MFVVVISWLLKAFADAIDHGKGSEPLYEWWHIFNNASYFVVYGYLVYLLAPGAKEVFWAVCAMLLWYPLYAVLRSFGFHRIDNKRIWFLSWMWSRKL